MSSTPEEGPPRGIWLDLEDALLLLAALEEARDALIQAELLGAVLDAETGIRLISRRLGLADEGDDDGT